ACRGVQIGFDEAGCDGVNANAFLGDFAGEADGQGVDGAFGGRVVDPFAGAAVNGGARGNVDDGSAASAMAGGHAFDGLAGAEKRAGHIDGQNARERRFADFIHTGKTAGDAGIIDKGAQGAEGAVGGLEKLEDVRLPRDIRLDGQGVAPGGLDVFDHVRGRGGVFRVVDNDSIAASGGEQGDGGPNAPAAAGHNHAAQTRLGGDAHAITRTG